MCVCVWAQTPEQLSQVEQEAIRLSEEIKAEYWAVSAKSGGRRPRPHCFVHFSFERLKKPNQKIVNYVNCPTTVPGDGVKDFFFRVASLTFEANVLSELEKGGSRDVSDIISESDC